MAIAMTPEEAELLREIRERTEKLESKLVERLRKLHEAHDPTGTMFAAVDFGKIACINAMLQSI
jgi:hypothetical protein